MMWRTAKKRGELYTAFVFLIFGIVLVIDSLRMPGGTFNMPGPGFYPAIVGVIFSGASFLVILFNLLKKGTDEIVQLGHIDIWSVVLALIAVPFLLERIGFTLVFALFLSTLLKKLSDVRLIFCIVWGVLVAVVAYLFFDTLLGVRLPYLLYFYGMHI